MRITIDVSDEFHNEVKACAALAGQTMRYFITDAIESKMAKMQLLKEKSVVMRTL